MTISWTIAVEENYHADTAVGQHLDTKWSGPKKRLVALIPRDLFLWVESRDIIDEAAHRALPISSRVSARRVAEVNIADALSNPRPVASGAGLLAAFVGSLSTTLIRTKPQQLTTPEQAWQQYIDSVKGFPEVVEVRLSSGEELPSVWTIISATPFADEPRERIIDAQIDVMQVMDRPMLGFQLINLQELGTDAVGDDVVPGDSVVLWNR